MATQITNEKSSSRNQKVIKPLTREELIEKAWAQNANFRTEKSMPMPPDNRILQIGDEVSVGNLKDCIVIGLSDDNRFLLVDYTSVDNNYGEPIVNKNQVSVFPWTSCIRKNEVENTQFGVKKSLRPSYLNSDIESLIHIVISRGIVDNPDYQRGYVWSDDDKVSLIDSVMNDRAIGSILFVDYPYDVYKGKMEVLDGKQRLNTLTEFFCSKFPYKGKFFHQFSGFDKHRFTGNSIQYAELSGARMSKVDLLKIFLDVNCGGVPQTSEHLNYVRAKLELELANQTELVLDSPDRQRMR